MFYLISKALSFLLNPLLYPILAFFAACFMAYFKKPVFKILIGILVYCLLVTSPLIGIAVRQVESSLPFPKIIDTETVMVLGGSSIYFDKEKEIFILGGNFPRFLEALRLLKNKNLKKIIISGGDPGKIPTMIEGESYSIQRLCLELGVLKENIIIEPRSLNTYQEAIYIKDYIEKNHLKKIVLVTTAMHMPRSVAVFKKQNIDVIPYPVNYWEHPLKNKWDWSIYRIDQLEFFLHETIGYIAYWMKGYI